MHTTVIWNSKGHEILFYDPVAPYRSKGLQRRTVVNSCYEQDCGSVTERRKVSR